MARKDEWLKKAEDWLAKRARWLEKRERWLSKRSRRLSKRARRLDCWSNGEALVYLLCRRLGVHEDATASLRQLWESDRKADDDFARRGLVETIHPVTGVAMEHSPKFWSLRQTAREFDTVDATMMRVADRVVPDIPKEFWQKVCDHLCWEVDKHFHREVGVELSQSEIPARVLFSLCRADLALREMREALRASLREVLRGKRKPAEPWVLFRLHPHDRIQEPDLDLDRHRDQFFKMESVAIAAAIVFGKLRIFWPDGEDSIVTAAGRFLVDKQLESGAWPEINPRLLENESILHTAMAMHALYLGTPNGWEEALKRGADSRSLGSGRGALSNSGLSRLRER